MPKWFDNAVSWFVNDGETADEINARGEAAEQRLAEMNREDAGIYGETWYQQTLANDRRQDASDELTISDEFEAEWDAGLGRLRTGVGDTIGFSLKTVFGALPWWLWLAIAGGLFLYFTGALKKFIK